MRIVGEVDDLESDPRCYLVAIGDNKDGDGECLQFQGGYDDYTEQDVRLGHDTYCIVRDPGQNAHYGGVVSWGLKDRVLVVLLSDQAAATLGTEGGFHLDLHGLDKADIEKLESGLTRVLVDVPRDDNLANA